MICDSCKTDISSDICPNCGLKQERIMCRACMKKFYKNYLKEGLCPECFEKGVQAPYKSPYLALGLSILPGLGHFYLGLKEKGAIFLFMFFLSCIIPILGWLILPIALIFPALDAYKTANRMNRMDELT